MQEFFVSCEYVKGVGVEKCMDLSSLIHSSVSEMAITMGEDGPILPT
jgi:hypothetical protein